MIRLSYRFVLMTAFSLLLSSCASYQLSQTQQQQIENKTYVITGASSGFGQGVALRLASYGANVVLAARRTELLEELADKARALGGTALVVTTDVAKPEDMQRLADKAVGEYGQIDVWINNAGVVAIGRFEDIPTQDHSRLIDVNLKGAIYGSHEAMRQFRKQGYGTLVNIGSLESELPLAYQASYAASKAGILALGRALNEENRLSGSNIQVATVMPWAANTPIWTHAANYSGKEPRLPTMDDPWKVVDAIIEVSLYPQEELPVGWKAQSVYSLHHILPDLTERVAANISHDALEKAAPAPATSGTIFIPMQTGRTVKGGNETQ